MQKPKRKSQKQTNRAILKEKLGFADDINESGKLSKGAIAYNNAHP